MVARFAQKWQIMLRRHKEAKNIKMCVTKLSKKIGSPKINIGNGWKKIKTTNQLKVRDHVVFIMIVISLNQWLDLRLIYSCNGHMWLKIA
jgi:hypothetical protein